MTNKLLCLAAFICNFAFIATAQKAPAFTVTLSKDTIGIAEKVTLVFQIENAQSRGFEAPSFPDFEVYGPSVSTEMRIVNGDISQKATYTYTLVPKSVGHFEIASATLRIDGKTLSTHPLALTVVGSPTTSDTQSSAKPYKPATPATPKKPKKVYSM